MAGKLTAIGVRALVKPGRYTDGDGLHLYVKAPDRRAWVLRYMRSGKSRDMGLGAYPSTTLAEARERAADARKHIRAGDTLWRCVRPSRARKSPPCNRPSGGPPES